MIRTAALAIAVAIGGHDAAQQTPARDRATPAKGTAIITGHVIDEQTGAPLRRAMVGAMLQDGRSSGMTTTDAEGRFEVRELRAGRYTVNASKAGYVSWAFGQRRADEPGTILDVLDGQQVEKIAIALPRGGAITGRITDEVGEPIAQAHVQALRRRYVAGSRRLSFAGDATTDDLGAFRIYGLVPGEYYVSASVRVNMVMARPAMGSAELEGFTPTYYPGTPNAADAQRVAVKAGQESGGVSFALTTTRLSRIRGRVLASSGEPVAGARVSVRHADPFAPGMPMPSMAQTLADGTFQITGVAAGHYAVFVMTATPTSTMPEPNVEFALARVTVGGDDVENLLLMLSRGAIARGVIATDEGIAPPTRPQQAMVFGRPLRFEMTPAPKGPSKLNADWTFEISGLFDRCVLGGSLGDPEWSVKAVFANGVDITDSGVEFVPGQIVDGFRIVFTRKRTDLSGALANDRGEPALDATVIAFAQDPRRWSYFSRYLRIAQPDQAGRYQFRGLPPGDYFVVAVSDLETGRQQDPAFLEQVRGLAARVSLQEAETAVQNLKVVRSPQ